MWYVSRQTDIQTDTLITIVPFRTPTGVEVKVKYNLTNS